jgi:hypothetical protein
MFDKILKLKKQQLYWYEKRKYLEVFRLKLKENGEEDWENTYPPTSILSTTPCKKYPRDSVISENIEKIESELLDEKNQKVTYTGSSIVIFKTEKK